MILEIVFGTEPAADDNIGSRLSGNTIPNDCRNIERFLWKDDEYIVRHETDGGKRSRLFIPQSFADTFCVNGNWLNYIAIERMLLPHDRMLIHASAVIYKGKAYLFSAPSGGGKSTHAAVWEKHFGAEVLNGDKVILSVNPDGCMAFGGPAAGSSGIYCNNSAPLAAIFMLQKANYNKATPISGRKAFLSLYSEAIKSDKDTAFNSRILDLLQEVMKNTPLYRLECLPESSAVECILSHLEGT